MENISISEQECDAVDFDMPNEDIKRPWKCFGQLTPSEVVFKTQIIVVYLIIITCIFNPSLHNEPHYLWVALMSSSLGYMPSSPTIKSVSKSSAVRYL